MTKIIGHRGAAGLALENSIESVEAALALDLDGIEFDVRRTKDGKLVVLHDWNTVRVTGKKLNVRYSTLAGLRGLRLKNGQKIPTLGEVLKTIGGKVNIMIDIKSPDVADELLKQLRDYPADKILFNGRQYEVLRKLHTARPDIPFVVQHHFDPLEIIHRARSMGASGICLNMWLVNPLNYRLAKKHGLKIYVYTINHRWLLRFFQMLYPDAIILSDHPERLL